jgi:hypothetical protein
MKGMCSDDMKQDLLTVHNLFINRTWSSINTYNNKVLFCFVVILNANFSAAKTFIQQIYAAAKRALFMDPKALVTSMRHLLV